MQKYLRVKERDILEDAYSQFFEYLEYPPYVTVKAMETVIAEVSVSDAAAKNSKPVNDSQMFQFWDAHFAAIILLTGRRLG